MKVDEVIESLRVLGSETTKKTLMKHGAREPLFGVKVGDMKPILKSIKIDYQLALDLYDTGILDAMYLAGLIADDPKMTRANLQHWVEQAYCSLLSDYTVAWAAAGSPHGWEMALQWIDAEPENIAAAGWSTLSSLVGITDDSALDLPTLEQLLNRVGTEIHGERNRVRSTMNGFIICVGGYVTPLTATALLTAEAVGNVSVDKGDTSCKIPSAGDYIEKMRVRGVLGKKRKTAKC